MSKRTIELHADWLGLVEPEGQFLSLPVLRHAFPNGLDATPTAVREQLRERYPRGTSPTQDEWDSWIDWLLRDALLWGPYYRCGEDASTYAHALPEYGVTLRADAALCDTRSGNPRILLMRYPHGTALERRLAGERWNASPTDRLTLLCRAQNVRLGIVTDGERIVLAWVPSNGIGGYATWDTAIFTESRERNLFQSFLSLLHASRFFAVPKDVQLESLFETSEKAQNEVTGQLGLQVRQAVELLVTALSRTDLERGGELLAGVSPKTVYEAAATVMMRLVFLLYAEERDLLPLADPLYAECYAASTLRDQLDGQAAMEGDEPLERRGAAWFRLLALFRVIYAGLNHDRLRLLPYGGRLFDPDRFSFLEGRSPGDSWSSVSSRPLPVDDLTVRAILEAIQTVPLRESGSRERRRLSFRSLDVEQIGHVYEGLLDHGAERVDDVYVGLVGKSGDEAEVPLVDLEIARKQGPEALISFLQDKTGRSANSISALIERGLSCLNGNDVETRRLVNTVCDNDANLASRIIPFVYALRTDLHGLPVIFLPQSLVVKQTRARRESGTEYTPRELAEEMVRYTLEPLVYSPGPKDGVEPTEWRLRPSTELLNLKICDPAVGSGAFLVSACRYLADRVVEAWIIEDTERGRTTGDELTLDARRAVVDRCLYGVDRDSMAVEMAKLSLWLITMARERPFSFLDHSIREGDSLLGITTLDQVLYAHLDPVAGRALHDGSLFNVTALVTPLVERASALRLELEALPNVTLRDAEEKQRLNDEANALLASVSLAADAVVAAGLSTASSSDNQRKATYSEAALRIRAALDTTAPIERRNDAIDTLRSWTQQTMNAGRPEGTPPRITLHWALAFPELFWRRRSDTAAGGFDALIGNPPFMGGQKITGTFGVDYRAYLLQTIGEGRRGSADLVTYFFLRSTAIGNSLAFLATNTIAQGDTREVGLDAMVATGWTITRAVKNRAWPGAAGVHIAQLWLSRDCDSQPAILDNVPVTGISPRLTLAEAGQGNPFQLDANANIAFQGSIVLGLGFVVSPDEAAALIEKDSNNADVLFPFLNAEDLLSRPGARPSRWVINFFDWPLERARRYRDVFAIIDANVKPERQRLRPDGSYQLRKPLPDRWWQYGEKRPKLYGLISKLDRVIAMPFVSKYMVPFPVDAKWIFAAPMQIFADASDHLLGILSSTLHNEWLRKYGSTLETRLRYSTSDCFETFPLPKNSDDEVARITALMHEQRSLIMTGLNIGLTSFYNLFHNPTIIDDGINEARALQARLDEAVLRSYGWADIALVYEFSTIADSVRWTIGTDTRAEVLRRLLDLNHARYREEREHERSLDADHGGNGKAKSGKKQPVKRDKQQMVLY